MLIHKSKPYTSFPLINIRKKYMKAEKKFSIFLFLAILFFISHVAYGNNVVPNECDRLAADPVDKGAVSKGVPWDKLDGERALKACKEAVKRFPDNPRYQYQYGRALLKVHKGEDGVKWYRKAAEQGNAHSQSSMGNMYYAGYGVEKDYAEAIRWYRKAAEQGDADGQVNLGVIYQRGEGVEKDYAEAIRWYRKAAEQENARGQAALGNMYYSGEGVEKDDAEAIRWYRKAAKQGDADGQVNLGVIYQRGEGVKKNYAEAVKWYRKAAEQGNARGQAALGNMYYSGEGVEKDDAEAVKWYRKAAEQGNARGQAGLGFMCSEGKGVIKDCATVPNECDRLAADPDDKGAVSKGVPYVKMDAERALKACKEAVKRFPDNPRYKYQYGRALLNVHKGEDGVKWIHKAAEQGYAHAQFMLGSMYFKGKGVQHDYAEAVRWYRKAAEQGNPDALYILRTLVRVGVLFLISTVIWIILILRQRQAYRSREEDQYERTANVIPFEFTGNAAEYFRIWIVNVFLSLITLGIYSAWAKVRKKRYFYGNTLLQSTPFEYLADPIKILKGRLIVFGFIVTFTIMSTFLPTVKAFSGLLFLAILPLLVVKARAFNARYSSYRNISFSFRAKYGKAYYTFFGLPILVGSTLGLAYPYYAFSRSEFVVSHSGYGKTPFKFSAPAKNFYSVYLKCAVLSIVALGALLNIAIADSLVLAIPLFVIITLVSNVYIQTTITNLVWSNTLSGTNRFKSTLRPSRMLWITLSNVIAILLSLGLLIPWATVRLARYRIDNLKLLAADDDLDGFIATEQEKVGAAGEEISYFYDFDVGL
jgi:TPR repeat protein/uncharacterized membrane protein YjgN (DUF898 family)